MKLEIKRNIIGLDDEANDVGGPTMPFSLIRYVPIPRKTKYVNDPSVTPLQRRGFKTVGRYATRQQAEKELIQLAQKHGLTIWDDSAPRGAEGP